MNLYVDLCGIVTYGLLLLALDTAVMGIALILLTKNRT